jgi:diadenosine tetraphosphatase ApaH/serine/threonine PP2A family protein phosphatase
MKQAILSDIHGNLEALQAVLLDTSGRGITDIMVLGDVVGYGADPKACLDLVYEHASGFVLGNHDVAAATGGGDASFNPDARAAIRWTRTALSQEDRKRIVQFPLVMESGEMHFSHASPDNVPQWRYVFTESDAKKGFAACQRQLVFVGHSHVPAVFVELEYKRMFGGEFRHVVCMAQSFVQVEKEYRYLLDVGSVGQPRDGDPRACYGIYDEEERRFELVRVVYDVHTAADKIVRAGLPVNLAMRLKIGR